MPEPSAAQSNWEEGAGRPVRTGAGPEGARGPLSGRGPHPLTRQRGVCR